MELLTNLKDNLEINKSSSIFDNVKFITRLGNDLSTTKIDLYSNLLPRNDTLQELLQIINNLEICIKIEAGLFEFSIVYLVTKNLAIDLFKSIYKDKLHDILENLDCKSELKNKTLKKAIIKAEINPQVIAFSKPHELHPKRWQKEIRKKELREYKKNNMAATDLYQCYKCKERKCKVTQLQIRSADEPLTNFITCLKCYNVWKC